MCEQIRCPACRGSKKVPKLGGMIGKCDTCQATGLVAESVRIKQVVAEPEPGIANIIEQVAETVPTVIDLVAERESNTVEILPSQHKRVIHKGRKQA